MTLRNKAKKITIALGAILSASFGSSYAAEPVTLIHAGELLSVPGQPSQNRQTLIIQNDKIKGVRSGYIAAEGEYVGAKIIDLKDKFVLPGLMDMHVHLALQYGGYNADLATWDNLKDKVSLSQADIAMNGTVYARRTLEAGFTTVRDLGTVGEGSFALYALRDAIDAGKIPGPRMFVAGSYISATSGHGDVEGLQHKLADAVPSSGVCDGPAECQKAVRTQVKRGATAIKFMATGGGGDENGKQGSEPEFFPEEMEAIVRTAHSFDRTVAAHAHGIKGIISALKAGADSIEHSSWVDDEAIELYRQTGAVMHPTLTVHTKILAALENRSPEAKKARLAMLNQVKDNFTKAHKAGVTIGIGTDAGVFPHGMNAKEFAWLVDIGMTPMEAIRAGTVVPARLLKIDDKLGTLEVGKIADIVATSQSPLNDIDQLQDVKFVMKAGQVYKND